MKPKLRFKEFSGEWIEKRLGEVAVCEDNKRIPLNETERKQRKGIYPYWGSTKVMDYVNDYIFNGEYVLLSEDGGYFYDYKEKPIAFYVNGKFWANNHIHVLKIHKKNNARFIYYALVHKNILAYIIGGTRTKLNQKDMLKIKIFTPPTLEEQQKIASFLSAVDEKIEITAKKIEKLKEYKKGLLQKLLNVKKGKPEFRFLEFSGKWVEKRLGEVCELKSGYSFKSRDYVENGRYMIITISNVKKGYLDLNEVKTINSLPQNIRNYQILKLGDILISMTGNVGRVCLVNKNNCLLNQRVGKLKIKNVNLNPNFLYYTLNRNIFEKKMISLAQGGAQLNISKKNIENFKIHLPPTLAEQQKIAEFLSSVDKKIEINEKKLSKLKEYKKGLLQKMLI